MREVYIIGIGMTRFGKHLERSEKEQCQQLHGHFGVMAKFVTTGMGLPDVIDTTPFRKRSYAREGKYGVKVLLYTLPSILVSLLSLDT